MVGRVPGRWVTASELAEYAYCPRAHWYAQVAPDTPVPARSAERSRSGAVYHGRTSRALRQRHERSGAYWAALLAGLLLLAVVLGIVRGFG